MSDDDAHPRHNEQPDLLSFNEAEPGTLSANAPSNHVQASSAPDYTSNEATSDAVIDSNISPAYQRVDGAEETPALPPRPTTTSTAPETMPTDHVADELPPPTTDAAPAATEPQHANPRVAQLKGMFPDFDDGLLESVLVSVNNNQDAAVDILLGMSDPSYTSSHQPAAPETTHANPSLELDEALARQLMLEDERQVRGQRDHRASGQSWPRRHADGRDEVPYETRSSQPQYSSSNSPPGQTSDLKETFNQIAESGKRTFTSIFSKVKAKINEFEANRPPTTPPAHPPPSWGTSSTPQYPGDVPYSHTPPNAQSPPPGSAATIPSYFAEGQAANGGRMDRHAASQYYGSDEGWTRVGSGGGRRDRSARDDSSYQTPALGYQPQAPLVPPATQTAAPAQEVRGYDIDDTPAPPLPVQAPASAVPEVTSSSQPEVLRPPTTQSGSPLDAAKFGLLPKRPVSLLRPDSSNAPHAHDDEDDEEDELDYVENPFEENRK